MLGQRLTEDGVGVQREGVQREGGQDVAAGRCPCPHSPSLCPCPGKSEVERWSDMYTVTSQLLLKVGREDDGVPVICLVDHPAVKDLQTQRYLEVMCE